jgi:hypothetical protein
LNQIRGYIIFIAQEQQVFELQNVSLAGLSLVNKHVIAQYYSSSIPMSKLKKSRKKLPDDRRTYHPRSRPLFYAKTISLTCYIAASMPDNRQKPTARIRESLQVVHLPFCKVFDVFHFTGTYVQKYDGNTREKVDSGCRMSVFGVNLDLENSKCIFFQYYGCKAIKQ